MSIELLELFWDSYPEIKQSAKQELFDSFLDFVNSDKFFTILDEQNYSLDDMDIDTIQYLLNENSSFVIDETGFDETLNVFYSIVESNANEFVVVDDEDVIELIINNLDDDVLVEIINTISKHQETNASVKRFLLSR